MTQATESTEIIADVRERVLYLQELGVETLDVELTDKAESEKWKVESAEPQRPLDQVISNLRSEISKAPQPSRPAGQSRLASLPSLSKRETAVPLRTGGRSGIPETSQSEKITETDTNIKIETQADVLVGTVPALPAPTETIEQIRAEIGLDCTRCKLCSLGRSKVVNSVGNFNADLMFVGEAPGADEDAQGEPFVGRAGQLLTKIIEGIGMRREDVFIGNINRCRPPDNRAPETDESLACKPFLLREIAVVRPKVIVVLGATAAQNLLDTKVPIGKLRGHFHDYLGVKVMPTFHPAYLLRDPHKKREVWEDMKMVRDYLRNK
jgi:uracil-DNA glycosylase family 4